MEEKEGYWKRFGFCFPTSGLMAAPSTQKCQLEKLLSEVNAKNVYSNFILVATFIPPPYIRYVFQLPNSLLLLTKLILSSVCFLCHYAYLELLQLLAVTTLHLKLLSWLVDHV